MARMFVKKVNEFTLVLDASEMELILWGMSQSALDNSAEVIKLREQLHKLVTSVDDEGENG